MRSTLETPAAVALPLDYAPSGISDLDLAWELADATSVLEMGEASIAAHVADDLRRRRLEAARELVARWERRT